MPCLEKNPDSAMKVSFNEFLEDNQTIVVPLLKFFDDFGHKNSIL